MEHHQDTLVTVKEGRMSNADTNSTPLEADAMDVDLGQHPLVDVIKDEESEAYNASCSAQDDCPDMERDLDMLVETKVEDIDVEATCPSSTPNDPLDVEQDRNLLTDVKDDEMSDADNASVSPQKDPLDVEHERTLLRNIKKDGTDDTDSTSVSAQNDRPDVESNLGMLVETEGEDGDVEVTCPSPPRVDPLDVERDRNLMMEVKRDESNDVNNASLSSQNERSVMEPHRSMLATAEEERMSNADTTSTPAHDDFSGVTPNLEIQMEAEEEVNHARNISSSSAPNSNEEVTNAVRHGPAESSNLTSAERRTRKTNMPGRLLNSAISRNAGNKMARKKKNLLEQATREPVVMASSRGARSGLYGGRRTRYPPGVVGISKPVPCSACGQKIVRKNLARHVISKHDVSLKDLPYFVARCVSEETRRLQRMRLMKRKRAALMSCGCTADGPATACGKVTGGDGDVREACDVSVASDVEVVSAFVDDVDGVEGGACGDNGGSMTGFVECADGAEGGAFGDDGGSMTGFVECADGAEGGACGDDGVVTNESGAENDRVGGVDETRGDAGGRGGDNPGEEVAGGVGLADSGMRGGAAAELMEAAERSRCACCPCHRRQETKIDQCLAALHRLEAKQTDIDKTTGLSNTNEANTGTPKWLLIKQRNGQAFGFCSWCCCHPTDQGLRDAWSVNGARLDKGIRRRIAMHAASKRHRICAEAQRARLSCSPYSTPNEVMNRDRRVTLERDFAVAYSMITRGSSYADFERELLLLDALSIKHMIHHQAHLPATDYVDVIYGVFKDEVMQYIRHANPTNRRPRHVHVSMDRVAVADVTYQAVNLRLLDTDANTVVVHGLTTVQQPHPDPVPIYTASLPPQLRGVVSNKNLNNGRGVLAQVTDYLQNDLGLTMDEIGRQALSASSHCEAMYTNPVSGFGRIWKEMHVNPAFLHLPDRPHQLEALFDNIELQPACDWMAAFAGRLHQIASVIMVSYQVSRHSGRTDERMDPLCLALQRFVEKSVVANSVEAIKCLLWDRTIVASVLEDGIASGVIDKDAVRSALNSLQDARFLLEALAVLDIMRPAVALISAGQSEEYSVFDDKRGVHQLITDIKRLLDADFLGNLERDGTDMVNGTFRCAPLQLSGQSLLARNTRAVTADFLREVKDRRRKVAHAILELSDLDKYLGQTNVEKLMTDVFNFARYPTDDSDLETHADNKLVDLVTRLCEGPLALSRGCGTTCRGPACQCLIAQFRKFKRRVMAKREHFRSKWYAVRDGVVRWLPEAVLRSFMQPKNNLHVSIPDITELIEICLVLSRSQANIEGLRKPAKFVVDDLREGKHDGTRRKEQHDEERKEVFIRENQVPVRFFPVERCADRWQNLHERLLARRSRTVKRVSCDGKNMKFMFSKI